MRPTAWGLTWTVVSLALVLARGLPEAAETVLLRMGHYLPKGPFLEEEARFADEVGRRTNGRVRINITWGEGLGKAGELLELTGQGAIDMATEAAGYHPDRLLFFKLLQIPFIIKSPEEAHKGVTTLTKELSIFDEEMRRHGVRYLYSQLLNYYYLFGNSAGCSLAGLRGKKIRSSGADLPKAIAAVGATPVTLFPAEWYEAIQRGTVDYLLLPLDIIPQFRLQEVGKYACGPIYTFPGHIIMINREIWNKLSNDLQRTIQEVADETQSRELDFVKRNLDRATAQLRAAGVQILEFPAADLAEWRSKAPSFLDAWVRQMEGRGYGEQARVVAQRLRQIIGR